MLYRAGDKKAYWETGTQRYSGNAHLVLQDDGNLVLYNPQVPKLNINPIWSSHTQDYKEKNAYLIM